MFNCGSLKAIELTINNERKIFTLDKFITDKPGSADLQIPVGGVMVGVRLTMGFKEQAACAGCGVLVVANDEEGKTSLCEACFKRLSSNSNSAPSSEGGDESDKEAEHKTRPKHDA